MYMNIKNEEVNFTYINNEAKETILWLHPAFTNQSIFIKQIESFSEYNQVLIDLPGHGNNNHLSFNMGDMPNITSQILGELNISKVHVVGVSLGSIVGQIVVEDFPEAVNSLTIVGGYSIHKYNQEVLKKQRKEMIKWMVKIIFSMKHFRKYVSRVSVRSSYGQEVFYNGAMDFKFSSFPSMQGVEKYFVPNENPFSHPTLVMVGEYDLDVAREIAKKLGNENNSLHIEIKDAGHCANIDQPETFNQELKLFLQNAIE